MLKSFSCVWRWKLLVLCWLFKCIQSVKPTIITALTLSFKETFNSVNERSYVQFVLHGTMVLLKHNCVIETRKKYSSLYKYALLIVEAIYCHCTVVILKNAHLVLSVNYLALASARSFFLFLLECIMCAF